MAKVVDIQGLDLIALLHHLELEVLILHHEVKVQVAQAIHLQGLAQHRDLHHQNHLAPRVQVQQLEKETRQTLYITDVN